MKKMFVLSLLTLAGIVPPAKAQVYTNAWENGRVQYNLNTFGYPPHPDMMGGYGYGAGYGGGNRAAVIIGGVAAGAGLGYGISGTSRGVLIGGVVGGGVSGLAAYAMNRVARGPQPRDCSKKKPGDKKCEAALAEAQAEDELAERRLRGGHLRNATGFPVVVTDCGDRVAVLQPGKQVSALEARCGYEGTMLVPSQAPGLREDRSAKFHVSDEHDGWVFVAPDIRRAAKGGVR